MSDEEDIFDGEIAKVEEEFGIDFPADTKIDLLEGYIHEELLEPDEKVPEGILRLSGLRRVNEVYGRLQESAEEANELIDLVHEENQHLTDEESEKVDRMAARMMMYEDTLLFLFLAHDLIETFSIQVLEKELVLDEYQGSNATWDALDEGIRTPAREELLRRTGIIDGTVKGEMGEVRRKRNLIAHRTEERQQFEFGPNVLELANKALHVLNELRFKLDGEKFWSKQGD